MIYYLIIRHLCVESSVMEGFRQDFTYDHRTVIFLDLVLFSRKVLLGTIPKGTPKRYQETIRFVEDDISVCPQNQQQWESEEERQTC